MSDEITLHELQKQYRALSDWNVILAYRGSVAHGMYVPDDDPDSFDDVDLIGVCVPPLDCYFGLKDFGSRGTQEIFQGKWDAVVYEARKAVGLLNKGNPNILSLLWLPAHFYLHVSPAGQELIDNRQLFAAKSTYFPFRGYAYSQLSKMTRGSYQGYMGAKRKELVERHGYDTKHAAHLIRLLRMGCEFLMTGDMVVDRTDLDADELLDVKRGGWSLERVQREGSALLDDLRLAYERSPLQEAPNWERVNQLCVDVVGGGRR